MSGFYKRKTKPHQWTDAEEKYLSARKKAGAKIDEIAGELGLSPQQVESKIYSRKWRESLNVARPKAPQDATEWAGGAYWRQPPARTWHKGITGRLIHLSATSDDAEDDDAKEAQ